MSVLRSLGHYVDAQVHPSAQGDPLAKARHRAFIAPRLVGSLTALVAFPAYLAVRGAPSALEVLVFCWLVAPILTSYFLSRTGRYESAHVLSALALTGLVTVIAAKTGGIGSFAAIWLVVVPLEAALSASRRVVAIASTLALAAAGLLVGMGDFGLLPEPVAGAQGTAVFAALGVVSASLYATGLALGAESLTRTSFWLLYAEEDRYRLLARNMTDVITRHGQNGVVLFASPAAEQLFGAGAAELRGHGLFDRVHIADRPAYLSALADAAAQGLAGSVEFRVRRDAETAAGPVHFIWIEMRCRPLDRAVTGPDGATREVVAVMREVTERKEQERALDQARTEAERANSAKSRFLATMSHELRTPLNAIIGFSDMLVNEKSLKITPERRLEYAQLINDSGNHLLAVVNDILDMSKLETGEFEIRPEPFTLAPVVRSCCDILALKAREQEIRLEAAVDPSLPELIADKRALKQILINLLSNAVKFTDRGGCITVSARPDGARVAISVEDNGIGIREDDLDRCGKPFFQSRDSYDRPHQGTGLGLSIVKGLVGLHGGEITMTSRLGAGTCVTVRIPLDCEPRRGARSPSLVPAASTVRRLALPSEPAASETHLHDIKSGEAGNEAAVAVKKRA
ncbi:MAG: PAS domain-containing sensor histidine kinase [Rhodoplanes sp.]|uniref:PAS domain-containing sensor histidine kinase n=1 Tax=Rhodoplanes sp. TaxID=1968906 RepID=UPI00185266C4|nr:PAS domain-containing sensor histidine kinase [Rhodoplanes sp.]NVO16048.1 PAS domain-containing sensor histidine kinase [Rhodoplanes sp.]